LISRLYLAEKSCRTTKLASMKLYGEISKTERQDDGTIKVWGYASFEFIDSKDEVVTGEVKSSIATILSLITNKKAVEAACSCLYRSIFTNHKTEKMTQIIFFVIMLVALIVAVRV
jgi:hypothetical protein